MTDVFLIAPPDEDGTMEMLVVDEDISPTAWMALDIRKGLNPDKIMPDKIAGALRHIADKIEHAGRNPL